MNKDLVVYVTGISPKATNKIVSDFFAFCGRITELRLRNDATGTTQEAIVVFESEAAAKTALLLSNALIVDRSIKVEPYNPEFEFHDPNVVILDKQPVEQQQSEQQQQQQQPHSESEQQQTTNNTSVNTNNPYGGVPDSERTKTSVIASMIAAGYSVGQDAITKARQLDEEHMISLKLKVGAETVKAKANEIDNKFHISENAIAIKNSFVETAKEVDDRFQLTGMFKSATDLFTQKAQILVDKVHQQTQEGPVAPIVNKVQNFGTNLGTAVDNKLKQFTDETTQAINEKKREKGIPVEDDVQQPLLQPQQQEQELQPAENYLQDPSETSYQQ
eukprot:gene7636-9393_t